MQMPGRSAGDDGDDGGDARPALRRPLPARDRLERPAGGRGLARPALRQAARSARASTSRWCAWRCAASGSTTTARRSRCRCPTGPGKALKLTIAPGPGADARLHRGDRPEATPRSTAEIADGWIPILFSPEHVAEFRPLLEEGFARAGGGKGFAELRHRPDRNVFVSDDRDAARDAMRHFLALYVGGMGSRKQNFYNQLVQRYGFEDAARTVQDLYLDGPQGRGRRRAARRADRRGLARAARPTSSATGSPSSATRASAR